MHGRLAEIECRNKPRLISTEWMNIAQLIIPDKIFDISERENKR